LIFFVFFWVFFIILSFCFIYGRPIHINDDIKQEVVEQCTLTSQEGTICKIHPKNIHPLQFGIAGIEVECKKSRLESMSKSKLSNYLQKFENRVNCIVGRGGIYLVDGHHMSRALYDANIKDKRKELYCNVIGNLVDLDTDDFWDELLEGSRIWLFDEKGFAPLAPEHLPSKLGKMIDDPYRTLAWMVQHVGGFNKTGVDFEDFMWSNFFRDLIDLNTSSLYPVPRPAQNASSSWSWCEVRPNSKRCVPDQIAALRKVLPLALQLSESKAASHLPGFGTGVARAPNCGNYTAVDFLDLKKDFWQLS